ncbi:MAG: dihydrodipicolinate synthase family protein [Actinophytocola sp.]|uniref:dihydrodipicolinate synthase family protein n=1 Tax=Actinophytocola sp. TaxID=1872138 RepID=UPI001322C58F|nr:dihydrodipicolinate synthase family protein [Actinophytocola sp.]MPZ81681.1 dihydrodipicolinate synthase family protein [Actinophytocola sp.]
MTRTDPGADPAAVRADDTPPLTILRQGCAIPAHPLALDDGGGFDPSHQRALTRYYLDSGARGLAVGVHSTEFAIRAVGLLDPVLELAAETVADWSRRSIVLIAGACGPARQAVAEAERAARLGYHAVLLSPNGLDGVDEEVLLDRTRAVAEVLPVVGFYLQPSAGGRYLSPEFWTRTALIPQVLAIKVAPFDRYQTLDVARGVHQAGRAGDLALYTGNDDNIVADLLTSFDFGTGPDRARVDIRGGLLGQWGVWAARAVELLDLARRAKAGESGLYPELLALSGRMTDANSAIFDARGAFRGCIPGIKQVLKDQGLVASTRCLDPGEVLSPGQHAEIDRVRREHPQLADDVFVSEYLDRWLA